MFLLSSFLSAGFSMAGFSILLSKRMKKTGLVLLGTYIFLFYIFQDASLGQWNTLLLVSGALVLVFWSTEKSLLDTFLSLTGYLILTLVDSLFFMIRSWSIFPLQRFHAQHPIPFALADLFLGTAILLCLRRFYLRLIYASLAKASPRLLFCFFSLLYLCVILIVFNFLYGRASSFSTRQIIINGVLVTVLSLCIAFVFFNMYHLLEQEQELSLQQARLSVMQDYTERMESLYEEMRSFRHDYKNILSTMEHYIDTGDVGALQVYFHEKIQPLEPAFSRDSFLLGKLHLIGEPALKGLLYTKLIAMLNHRLNISLEISERIERFPMDNLTLCRILGILLDNAIEAAVCSVGQTISLAIIRAGSDTLFVIGNDSLPPPVPVSRLFERGCSTKEGHAGLGLATVRELIEPLSNVFLSTEWKESYFSQTLTIQGEELP